MSSALESQPGLVPRSVQEFGHIPGKLGRGPLLEGGPPEEQQGRESLPLHLLSPEDGHRLPGQLLDLGGAPSSNSRAAKRTQRSRAGVSAWASPFELTTSRHEERVRERPDQVARVGESPQDCASSALSQVVDCIPGLQ